MSDSLIVDIRLAIRGLARRPAFTLTALLTLALGIGANSAVFSLVNALLLRPLPLGARGERVVTLHSTHASQFTSWQNSRLSFADMEDVRASARTLEDVAGYASRNFTVVEAGEAERIRGGSVTPNLFRLLGLQPMIGRHFNDDEAKPPGFEPVVLISHRLWQRRFGGDPGVLGKSAYLNGRPLTVIGVMPPGIRFPERDDIWVPWHWGGVPQRAQRGVMSIGMLKPGVTLNQAQAELDALALRLAETHPETNRGWGIRALSFRELVVDRGMRAILGTLLAAVGAVLLIGCANLANLILARGVTRQRELAVRSALGGSRARLIREMLVETGVLAVGGGLLGLALGGWAIDLMVAVWPEELPYWVNLELDGRVVAFSAFVAVLAALAAGLLPALRSSRPDLVTELRDGARGSAGASQQRVQGALVVAQVALSLALLVGANLMIRSFMRMQSAPAGFADDHLLSMRFNIAGDAYDSTETRAAFVSTLVERLHAVPGIRHAAVTSSIPIDDGGAAIRIVPDGRPIAKGEEPGAQRIVTSPSLFETLGVPVLEGRTFSAAEHGSPGADVAIVNAALARAFWPGGAVGQRVGIVEGDRTRFLRIVGVVADVQYEEFGEENEQSRRDVFVPYASTPLRSLALLVRTSVEPHAVADPVRKVFRALDPGMALWDVRSMEEVRALTTWEQRFFGKVMGAFAAQAVLLACLGVYGVLAYAVGRRTREIGVRLALGATRTDVVTLVVGRGARLAALGVVAGLVLSLAVGRVLQSNLYGVDWRDPLPFLATAALLASVILVASLLPARRAASVDPIAALRSE